MLAAIFFFNISYSVSVSIFFQNSVQGLLFLGHLALGHRFCVFLTSMSVTLNSVLHCISLVCCLLPEVAQCPLTG